MKREANQCINCNTHDGSRKCSKSASPLRFRPILIAKISVCIGKAEFENSWNAGHTSDLTRCDVVARRSRIAEAVNGLHL
jgi:hypothetical protein